MDPLTPGLNVVGVFNSCLEVFKFIQKGRKFGEEYEERLDKFEAAKQRLLNWGDRVAIPQDTHLHSNFEYNVEPVFRALRRLEQLFTKVQRCLEKYEIQVQASEDRRSSQPFGSALSNGIFEEWNKNRKDQAQQRGKQTKIIQKAQFVLDAETLDDLFVKIEYFLNFLESEERHRSIIGVEHSSYNGQWRLPSYGGQIYSHPEDHLADDARCEQISAPAGAVSPLALRPGSISMQSVSSGRQSHFRDSFNWRVSSASDASSFSVPSRTLSEPPLLEDTSQVWREAEFDEKKEQTEHSAMDRPLSNMEHSTQQPTAAETAPADTGISAVTAPPFLDPSRRHNSFPIFNQQRNSSWTRSLASTSSSTVEGFSSRPLNPNLNGRKCLASSLDGSRVAVLTSLDTGFEVCLFDINQTPPPGQHLETLGWHPLERGTWTGVAIAGSYLAAWGEKLLHLAVRRDSPEAVKYDVCFAGQAPTFNTSQKAALSRNGVLASTNGQGIELRFASRPKIPVLLQCPVKVTKSIDVAFNEEGDNLYYWARILNAFLFSWQLKDVGNNPNPVSATQYQCKQGEKIGEATLFPYNRQRGCIVGYSARTICFPGLISGKHSIEKPVKRRISEELKRKQVQAATVLDDSSLIAIQGPSSRFNSELAIHEYPLQGSGMSASIGSGKKLGKLSMKFRNKEEAMLYKVSAFRDQGERTLHVVVCSPDANVEVFTVKGNG